MLTKLPKGPSLGWDVHLKMIWCVDRAGTDSPDPWTAAVPGPARSAVPGRDSEQVNGGWADECLGD